MGNKEKLVLFLIGVERGIKTIYGLVRHFDRAHFPADIGKSIDELVSLEYVIVSGFFDNGAAGAYEITEAGKQYLKREFNREEILEYIQTFDNPELTRLYVSRSLSDTDGRDLA